MQTFLFRCPVTGRMVQGATVDKADVALDFYEAVECTACRQVHLVNPRTGQTVGKDSK